MARFVKFLILAVVGFGLGSGLAWFQKSRQAGMAGGNVAIVADESDLQKEASTALDGSTIVPDAPAMPGGDDTAQDAGEEAVTDQNVIDAIAEDTAADRVAPKEMDVEPGVDVNAGAQKVAGSTVGGAFSLTDHNGNAVTEAAWPGKMKLVFFGFTHCPDICPTNLDKMTTVLEQWGAAANQVQPLFITTDPARDTPERLKEYLADYSPAILGLTGTEEQIAKAKDGYKVYAAKVDTGDEKNYLMDHSGYIYLMSADDALLEIFGSSDTGASILEKAKPHLAPAE